MPGSTVGLGLLFSARDMASGPIGLLRRNFAGLQRSVSSGAVRVAAGLGVVAGGVTLLSAGLGTLRGAFSLAETAGGFEQTMVSVGAISRASRTDMDLLRRSAIDAGIATQFSPREAAEGLQSLAAAGQNATNATTTLIPVLDLAAGSLGQLGVAGSAEAVVGTLNAYGMAASEATRVTDLLLRTTQMTNFQARDFQVGLSRAATTGAQYGQSLEDVLITMGLLRNANIEASVASTSMREAWRRLATDQRAQQTVARAGVEIFDAETGRIRPMIEVMGDLGNVMARTGVRTVTSTGEIRTQAAVMTDLAASTATATEQQSFRDITTIFGIRGMAAFNAVSNANIEVTRNGTRETLRGADAIREMRVNLFNAAGAAAEFRRIRLATFLGKIDLLVGSIQTFGIVVGEAFAEIFTPLIGLMVDALNIFIRAWDSIPRSFRRVIAIIVLVGGAFGTASGFIITVVGIVVLLVAVLGELLIVAGAVAAGMIVAMLPVVAAIGAIGVAIIALRRAWQENLGGLRTWTTRWVNRITLAWRALTEVFTTGGFSEEVYNEMQRAGNEGVMGFVIDIFRAASRIKAIWDGLVTGFESMWEQLAPTFEFFMDSVDSLGESIGLTTGALTTQVNSLGIDRYEKFGQTLGVRIAGGLQTVLILAAQLVLVLGWLIRAVTHPAFQTFLRIVLAIAGALGDVVTAVQTLRGAMESFNPVNWVMAAVQGATGADVTAVPLLTSLGIVSPATAGGPAFGGSGLAIPAPIQRGGAPTRAPESGTARPAATQAESVSEMTSQLQELNDTLSGRGQQRGRPINIRNRVEVDSRVVSERVDRFHEDNAAANGQSIPSDSFWD